MVYVSYFAKVSNVFLRIHDKGILSNLSKFCYYFFRSLNKDIKALDFMCAMGYNAPLKFIRIKGVANEHAVAEIYEVLQRSGEGSGESCFPYGSCNNGLCGPGGAQVPNQRTLDNASVDKCGNSHNHVRSRHNLCPATSKQKLVT